MTNDSIQERRQYKRIKKNFIARFRLKNDVSAISDTNNWEMITTQNLSAGGLLFNYDKEIQIRSIIDMFINFPQIKTPVNCVSRVLRIDKGSSSSLIKVAANFINISENDKQAINKAAEEFYSKRLGRIEP
jgi:c-di-GMP-binding flagellar brake protein YcgR